MNTLKMLFDATKNLPEESNLDFAVRMGWDAKEEKRLADEARAAERAELQRKCEALDLYTPQKIGADRFTFALDAKPCVYCSTPTISSLASGPFPAFWRAGFDEQRKRAGIHLLHHWHDTWKPVCVECKDKGVEKFNCVACKQTRSFNESHLSFGAPAEHLCTTCWETVSAKNWAALVGELEEQHRYDFE